MLPHTALEPRDDPTFLAVVDKIIAAFILRDHPQDVHLIHIDNWFGPKWLRSSGKGVVAFPHGYAAGIVSALDDHYQDKLTFPPFTRNRIVSEHYFCRAADGVYQEQCPTHLAHRRRWRWKEQNVHRRVASFSNSGFFAWYSSGTAANDRGSLMVYWSHDGAASGWYSGFMRRNGWHLDKVSGIDRELLAAWVGGDPPPELAH